MANTDSPLRVYTLDDLPEEVVSVVFAKTSRVPDSFDEIARELSRAKSSKFHEKWVVGYGHSSVAEHAVLSIAIENVSILGAKVVEENRLSSFTEKSTRYQVMDPERYYTPSAFSEGCLAELYHASIARLYSVYGELMPRALSFCEEKYGGGVWKAKGISPRSKACDMLRGLLPCAAKTNLGWTVNARSLRHALVKMASQPLDEIRDLGSELLRVCLKKVPTLLKHTERSSYLDGWDGRIASTCGWAVDETSTVNQTPSVRLVSFDPSGEKRVLASMLFRATGCSYDEAWSYLSKARAAERERLIQEAQKGVGDHEAPVREFENTYYTFEVICDYGAYRDIQRHRMTTQSQQLLTCDLGFNVPSDALEAGVATNVSRALEDARESWRELCHEGRVCAQYAVPLAFNKRFLMTMNFREAHHFIRLRSCIQGHESYRRVAWSMKKEIERVHPALGSMIPALDPMELVQA